MQSFLTEGGLFKYGNKALMSFLVFVLVAVSINVHQQRLSPLQMHQFQSQVVTAKESFHSTGGIVLSEDRYPRAPPLHRGVPSTFDYSLHDSDDKVLLPLPFDGSELHTIGTNNLRLLI